MFNFVSLASGSKGNCYLLSDDDSKIMIECGIRWNLIQRKINFKSSEVDAVLISHSHSDHAVSVCDVLKAGINVYTSEDTANELKLSSHRLFKIDAGKQIKIKSFQVMPFSLEHDVTNFGFLILSPKSNKKLVYITDTSYCKYKFNGLTHLAIECNYAKQILEDNIDKGKLHPSVRNRIVRSHFGLHNVIELLKANDLSKLEQIYLLHLSDGNSNAALFKKEIEKLTGIPVQVC